MILLDEALSTHLMALGVMLTAETLKVQFAMIYQLATTSAYRREVIDVAMQLATNHTLPMT